MRQRKFSTVLDLDPPLTDDEKRSNLDRFLESERRKLATARALVIEACKSDSRFLDKLLKDIRPLRGPGFTKAPTWRSVAVASIFKAMRGHQAKNICEVIAATCKVSESTARRLYDEHRSASQKAGFVKTTKR